METYKTNIICSRDGQIWRSEGTRQAQSPGSSTVLKAIADAVIEPICQEALNKDVIMGRSFGYDNSPIMAEPEMIQTTSPNPSRIREMMYIATGEISIRFIQEEKGLLTMLRKPLNDSSARHDQGAN